jgi:TolB protein
MSGHPFHLSRVRGNARRIARGFGGSVAESRLHSSTFRRVLRGLVAVVAVSLPYCSGGPDVISVSPSPTGSPEPQIAFLTKIEPPHIALIVSLLDGSERHRLSPSDLDVSSVMWSPNGSMIVFAAGSTQAPGSGGAIFLVMADGSRLTRLTAFAGNSEPAWSPDGRQVAFAGPRSGGESIFVVNADGTGLREVTHNRVDVHPSWSPDGQAILFSRQESSSPGVVGWAIYSVDLKSGDLTRRGSGFAASWSPNGEDVLYIAGQGALFLMRADGTHARLLPSCGYGCLGYAGATWSPDGTFILAWDRGSVAEGGSDIFGVSANGVLRRVFGGPEFECCASLQAAVALGDLGGAGAGG